MEKRGGGFRGRFLHLGSTLGGGALLAPISPRVYRTALAASVRRLARGEVVEAVGHPGLRR